METGTGPRELFWYLGPVPDTNRDCELLSQEMCMLEKKTKHLEEIYVVRDCALTIPFQPVHDINVQWISQ